MFVHMSAKYEYMVCEGCRWNRVRLACASNGMLWLRNCVRTVANCGSLVYMQKCAILYLHRCVVERTLWTVGIDHCYYECEYCKYYENVLCHYNTYRNGSCEQKIWSRGFFKRSTYRFGVVIEHRLRANIVNVYNMLLCLPPLEKFFLFYFFISTRRLTMHASLIKKCVTFLLRIFRLLSLLLDLH